MSERIKRAERRLAHARDRLRLYGHRVSTWDDIYFAKDALQNAKRAEEKKYV